MNPRHDHCWHDDEQFEPHDPRMLTPWWEAGPFGQHCCHCGATRTGRYVAGPDPVHGRFLKRTGKEWHTIYSEPRAPITD